MKEFHLTPELADALDKFEPSPAKRAEAVWSKLSPEFKDSVTTYDLVCFCIEVLALQAQNDMTFMIDAVKKNASVFYYAHYLRVWMKHHGEMENGTAGETSNTQSASGTISESDNGEGQAVS